MQNAADLENGLNMQLFNDIESLFDFYAQYELDQVDSNKTVLVN